MRARTLRNAVRPCFLPLLPANPPPSAEILHAERFKKVPHHGVFGNIANNTSRADPLAVYLHDQQSRAWANSKKISRRVQRVQRQQRLKSEAFPRAESGGEKGSVWLRSLVLSATSSHHHL